LLVSRRIALTIAVLVDQKISHEVPRFVGVARVALLWRQRSVGSDSMKAVQGYHLIKPEDLSWRPSKLMKIPNADYLEAHREWESRRPTLAVAAQEREHAAQAHPRGGILFRAGRF